MKLEPSPKPRLIVGISGASGTIYGVRLLELLQGTGIETHLIMSRAAQVTLAHETDFKVADVEKLATVVHSNSDIGAACSSGSFRTLGMVIAPCSIKTMAEIATGATGHLLSRAADVALKERRRVVLVLRETPLHLGHIRSMAAVTEAGAIVYPPVPAMYARPKSIAEMVDHTLGRVLDLFDIDMGLVRRWTGEPSRPREFAGQKEPARGHDGAAMAASAGSLDNPFWNFSLAVYAAPGVADECLALQESCGVDVNVLLFCAWLASVRKVAVTHGDIEAIAAVVGAWHESAVKPLRGVRRYMKTMPGGEVALLRTRVKGAELEAEQIEQAMLFAHAEAHWTRAGQGALPAALHSNLETYLRAQGYRGPGGDALPLRSLCAAVKALPAAS